MTVCVSGCVFLSNRPLIEENSIDSFFLAHMSVCVNVRVCDFIRVGDWVL